MLNNKQLTQYLAELLAVESFKDYCPNGLQVEGKSDIKNIICGVSANLELIQSAITNNADAIIVHHGLFWHKDTRAITGAMRKKIALLLAHNINLYAYHLPLDAHPKYGNNIELARILNIKNPKPIPNSLLWQGNIDITIADFITHITNQLDRKPLVVGVKKQRLTNIAWCSGGAQNYLVDAINLGVDVYLSGEISEQNTYTALENNITYISAGHHATERYGVQALSRHLADKFAIKHQFIDINNIV